MTYALQLEESSASPDVPAQKLLGPEVTCWKSASGVPPLFVMPVEGAFMDRAAFLGWLDESRAALDQLIIEHGALVLRGFPLASADDFRAAMACFPAYEGGYQGGASPRQEKLAGVYEATQMSGRHTINLHQEMHYLPDYPSRIAFFARKVAEEGGETTIADMGQFTRGIPEGIRAKLEARGVRYVRNFAAATGNRVEAEHADRRGWDFAFYTDSREDVEQICKRRGMDLVWNPDGSLTTFTLLPAFETHPSTGEAFYRAYLHGARVFREPPRPGGLADQVRKAQVHPTAVTLGDGTDLDWTEQEVLEDLIARATIQWPWGDGDLLLLDNLQTAHGRNPYRGERETLVAMLN